MTDEHTVQDSRQDSRQETDEDAVRETGHDADRAWAKSHHERAGEVELIISGAVIFGLFQVPGYLDGWFDALQLRLGPTYYTTVFVAWYYTKLIVFTLIGGFGIHILTRAYWIGLLGLDATFPDGIRWDRIRYGPLALDEYRRTVPTVVSMARRADRFAGTVFAGAFWVVLLFATSVLLAGGAGLLTLALGRWVLPEAEPATVWVTIMTSMAAVPVLLILGDRALGARIDPGGPLGRLVRGGLRGWSAIFAGPLLLPIQFTLFSNLRRRQAYVGMTLIFAALIGLFVVGEQFRRGAWFVSAAAAFPTRTGPLVANARYYENQDPDVAEGVPTIPSDVIRGAYVRLRVPFVARRDAPRLDLVCPDLPPRGRQGLVSTSDRAAPPTRGEEAALLVCVARLWTVRLDGQDLEGDWSLSASGGNGIGGLVAYIPTEPLAPGAHLLEVTEVLRADPETAPETAPEVGPGPDREAPPYGGDDDAPRRHYIRFWI